MEEYSVEITETLTRVVTVHASSSAYAVHQVKRMYREEDIVLDYDDFSSVNFNFIIQK